MRPRDERETTVVIVDNRDHVSSVSENEPKQRVSMAVRILHMLCLYVLPLRFYL